MPAAPVEPEDVRRRSTRVRVEIIPTKAGVKRRSLGTTSSDSSSMSSDSDSDGDSSDESSELSPVPSDYSSALSDVPGTPPPFPPVKHRVRSRALNDPSLRDARDVARAIGRESSSELSDPYSDSDDEAIRAVVPLKRSREVMEAEDHADDGALADDESLPDLKRPRALSSDVETGGTAPSTSTLPTTPGIGEGELALGIIEAKLGIDRELSLPLS